MQEAAIQLLADAWLHVYTSGRSHLGTTADPEIECMVIRAQEMARWLSTARSALA